MTEQRSFKRLVRARMEKTGERYAAARASLLQGKDAASQPGTPVLPMSDETILRRTGQGWEDWLDRLDDWGAGERSHGDIAAWVAEHHGIDGWSAQALAVGYERARGGRRVGETAQGFSVGASKTVAVPVERLYDAFVAADERARWLPDGDLRERTATRPKSARYDWAEGTTRVHVGFDAKGDAKSTVAVQHERLRDPEEAERMKAYWRAGLTALKDLLEG